MNTRHTRAIVRLSALAASAATTFALFGGVVTAMAPHDNGRAVAAAARGAGSSASKAAAGPATQTVVATVLEAS